MVSATCPYWSQVIELATMKHTLGRLRALQRWQRDGGVMIMGYDMYRILSLVCKINNDEWKEEFYRTLVDPGPVTLLWHATIKRLSILGVVPLHMESDFVFPFRSRLCGL